MAKLKKRQKLLKNHLQHDRDTKISMPSQNCTFIPIQPADVSPTLHVSFRSDRSELLPIRSLSTRRVRFTVFRRAQLVQPSQHYDQPDVRCSSNNGRNRFGLLKLLIVNRTYLVSRRTFSPAFFYRLCTLAQKLSTTRHYDPLF